MAGLLKRLQDWWERTPPAFTGPVWANLLGWQLLRVLFFNLTRTVGTYRRLPEATSYAKTLKEDGIVLIPDFLPRDAFAAIREAYEKESAGVPQKPLASKYIVPKDGKTKVGYGLFVPEEGGRLRTLLDEHLIENPVLRAIGASVVHHDIERYRAPQVFINKKMGDEYPDLNSDIYYHCDVSYPGVKAFLYLSDTDEGNGAFTYAKGTHRLTPKRLLWDYRKSIEHARNRARVRDRSIIGDESGRAWHCLTREEEKREGIRGTSMNGKANALVVFNVMGFHRRGEFSSERPREFVMAYYRD